MIPVIFDKVINILKWPIAVLSVLILIPTIKECYGVLIHVLDRGEVLIPLFIGGIAYILISRIIVGKKKQGWISTLEHELTHAFFALITFHKVNGIQTLANEGG